MFILQWYPIEYQYVNQELAIGYGRERVTDFVHSSFGERGDSLVKQRGVKHGETVECRHAIDVHPIGNGERNTLRNPPNCPNYRPKHRVVLEFVEPFTVYNQGFFIFLYKTL